MTDKKQFWDNATKSGLVLGGISIVFMLINLALASFNKGAMLVIANVLSPLLWIAKLVACILLLKFFIKKYFSTNSELTARNLLNQGRAIALLSAALFAAFNMAYYMYIDPDFFEEILASVSNLGIYTADQLNMLKDMGPQVPTYSFFGTLIYCYLFGSIASSFIVRKLISANPFNNAQ